MSAKLSRPRSRQRSCQAISQPTSYGQGIKYPLSLPHRTTTLCSDISEYRSHPFHGAKGSFKCFAYKLGSPLAHVVGPIIRTWILALRVFLNHRLVNHWPWETDCRLSIVQILQAKITESGYHDIRRSRASIRRVTRVTTVALLVLYCGRQGFYEPYQYYSKLVTE